MSIFLEVGIVEEFSLYKIKYRFLANICVDKKILEEIFDPINMFGVNLDEISSFA